METSVNRDHALWYEFKESGQSTAVKPGWDRYHPRQSRGERLIRGSSGALLLTESGFEPQL
jgi:hypothetical protein